MNIQNLIRNLPDTDVVTAGYAQTLDKAKLDQFFDRLAEKNKARGSLIIAKTATFNKPFQIAAFETIVVSPEVLDKYVGVYSSPEAPVKFTITRAGSTLFFQPPGQSAVPLEATAQDKFQIEGAVVIEFDAAKNQMIIKRRGGERVFTKEKQPS